MSWRRSTWALVLWNLVWVVLVVVWLLNPALEAGKFSGGAFTTGPRAIIPTKPPDWAMFEYWFVGFALLATAWLLTRRWAGRHRKS